MITIRVPEEQVEEQKLKVKCPACGKKLEVRITEDQRDKILDGDGIKYFCSCTEGFQIEIEY